jgi:hypothetical protein
MFDEYERSEGEELREKNNVRFFSSRIEKRNDRTGVFYLLKNENGQV